MVVQILCINRGSKNGVHKYCGHLLLACIPHHPTGLRIGWAFGHGGGEAPLQGQDIEVRTEGGSRLRGWSEMESPPKLTGGGAGSKVLPEAGQGVSRNIYVNRSWCEADTALGITKHTASLQFAASLVVVLLFNC